MGTIPLVFGNSELQLVLVKRLPARSPFVAGSTVPLSRITNNILNIMAGWWFGTFFIFPYIGKNGPN